MSITASVQSSGCSMRRAASEYGAVSMGAVSMINCRAKICSEAVILALLLTPNSMHSLCFEVQIANREEDRVLVFYQDCVARNLCGCACDICWRMQDRNLN